MGDVIKFAGKRAAVETAEVTVYTLQHSKTGVKVKAVDEAGAAMKLRMSLAVFRALKPVAPIEGIEPPFYAVEAVVDAMRIRGIGLGYIVLGEPS